METARTWPGPHTHGPRTSPNPSGFSLGRILGVAVQIDWSLLIVFSLIVFNLGAGVFPQWHPNWGPGLRWGTSILAALLFFASVLIHELSHALVARAQGIPVRQITLFLFGGLAQMEGEPPSPRAEFFAAIVGPLTSMLIGVAATLVGAMLAQHTLTTTAEMMTVAGLRRMMSEMNPLATLLLWLGPINIILALFNTLPGFPLDGGRVLRAIFWAITDDLTRATRWASRVGQGFAWMLMAIGVTSVFSGMLGQGLWLLLLGWFLNNAARLSYEQQLLRSGLRNVVVHDVMRTQLDRVPPWMHVDALVREHFMTSDQHAFPVEDEGTFRGLVCLDDVRKIAQSEWGETPVATIMTPARELTTLPPDAPAETALEALARRDVDQIPIVEGTHLLGLVRRGDLVKWLALTTPKPDMRA